MVRRTKQEAQATRSHILDTAERVFEAHGVSGTSLNAIADAAGLTRGAIYWHFENKADLFNAMLERVTLPLEETERIAALKSRSVTLAQMRDGFVDVLQRLTDDPQVARVFDIATHKVEYVDEMNAVRARRIAMRDECVADVERGLKRARTRGELRPGVRPRPAALGMIALIDGLLQNWLLDRSAFDLPRVGGEVFDAYMRGLATAPG